MFNNNKLVLLTRIELIKSQIKEELNPEKLKHLEELLLDLNKKLKILESR